MYINISIFRYLSKYLDINLYKYISKYIDLNILKIDIDLHI